MQGTSLEVAIPESYHLIPYQIARNLRANNSCLEWAAFTNANGYGQCTYQGKRWLVHRLVYTLLFGPLSSSYDVDHLCANRLCANPNHLRAITSSENRSLGGMKSTGAPKQDSCDRGHLFTPDTTIHHAHGTKTCRICRSLRRRGAIPSLLGRPLLERFESKLVESGTCIEWSGAKTKDGYGKYSFNDGSGKKVFKLTHRLAWELYVGDIPEGLVVDHLCFNRACCNIAHLELVTRAENNRRRQERVV